MMLRYSFDMETEAQAIENAVEAVLEAGYRTGDTMSEGMKILGCKAMGEEISQRI